MSCRRIYRQLGKTGEALERMGHEVRFVTPGEFATLPCPTYPSIRLAVAPGRKLRRILAEFNPQAIHIATEGPVGLAARRYCRRRGLAFTTSFHTQFPEYVRLRAPVPLAVTYAFLRWFHAGAARTLVPTETRRRQLVERGFKNVFIWTRGVDTQLFRPCDKGLLSDERPISMYMGRVAVEKNIEAFLSLDLPGTKYVVGDGPDLELLCNRYPQVRFTGFKFGEDLARHLDAADVFVFPSLTDTFGLVLLEAMACGVPVAAYPVSGPLDVVRQGVTGILDDDLREAVLKALHLDGEACRDYALAHSWEAATEQFASHMVANEMQGGKGPGAGRTCASD